MTHKIEMNDSIGFGDTMDAIKVPSGITSVNPRVFMKAERARMILNPNREVVDKIISRIFKCGGKCPCQPQDSDVDTRCPCSEFTDRGVCHCKLFVPESDV